jgi:hypothetical protein
MPTATTDMRTAAMAVAGPLKLRREVIAPLKADGVVVGPVDVEAGEVEVGNVDAVEDNGVEIPVVEERWALPLELAVFDPEVDEADITLAVEAPTAKSPVDAKTSLMFPIFTACKV